MHKTFLRCTAILALGLSLAACKIVRTADTQEQSGENSTTSFNPDKMVAAMWDSKVIPYLEKKAGPFIDVRDLARGNADAAGTKFGFRENQGGSPWTVVVRIEGRIVAANTESRAATIDVDVDADGKADARIQIGPAMRGTALRDCLDFISFNDFTNQIDFAQFGKAFNLYADKTFLSKLSRDGLAGKSVKVLGAFPLAESNDLPLVTPARLELGPAS